MAGASERLEGNGAITLARLARSYTIAVAGPIDAAVLTFAFDMNVRCSALWINDTS